MFDDLLSGVYSSTVADVAVLVREVRVRIGVLSKAVTIRIYYDARQADPYSFEMSALMKPASDDEPHDAPREAPTENEALRRAVRCLTEHYENAVRRGELPDDTWLVRGDVSR